MFEDIDCEFRVVFETFSTDARRWSVLVVFIELIHAYTGTPCVCVWRNTYFFKKENFVLGRNRRFQRFIPENDTGRMVTREHPGFVCWNSRFRGVFRELSRVKVRSRCSRFLKKYHPRNFEHVRSSHLSGTGLPGRKNIVPRTILLPGPARCGLRVFCYGFRCRNLSAPSTRYFFFFFLQFVTSKVKTDK